jgi:arylsulfatase A-like enzyme
LPLIQRTFVLPGLAETLDKFGKKEGATLERELPSPERLCLRPRLAWLSIVAILSLSLEIELLQQIDSLRLYLRAPEIVLEASVALLLSIVIATIWWLTIFLAGQSARVLLPNKWIHLSWNLWIALPLVYLSLELFQDLKLEIFPRWHLGGNAQITVSFTLSCACVAVLLFVSCSSIQKFCETRLVPIAWIHIAAVSVAAIALWAHGVRLFKDYEHPSTAISNSNFPDIYIISLDALRADDMSLYGYRRSTTPNLEKFAQRSFAFDYDFANSNFTTPSTSSIETGKLPWSHRIYQFGGFLRDQSQGETLPALLKRQGYYTAMISSNIFAAPFRHRTLESYDAVQFVSASGVTGFRFRESNLVGVNTQFTVGYSLLRGLSPLTTYVDRVLWRDRYPSPAEDVFQRAERLLEGHAGGQPIFLWSHILPPHDPYWVPTSYRNHFVPKGIRDYDRFTLSENQSLHRGVSVNELRDSYDEMIQYADQSVGDFLDWLDRTGRLNRSIVIITSDHGEMFDHGRLSHGGPDLYNGVIHIPLLIHLPGQNNGAHIEQLAQQADLLPTVLDLVAAPIPGWVDGASLKPLLAATDTPQRYIFSMNLEPNRIFDPISKGTVAVMDSDFKFVRYLGSGDEQLYRYKTDAAEEYNLIHSEPEVAERMRQVLLQKIKQVNQRLSETR